MSEKKEDSKDDLSSKLKTMSLEELKQYEGVTNGLNHAVNFLGVMVILFMLHNTALIVLLPCAIILYVLASTGANTVKFRAEIKKLIEAKDK